MRCKGFAYDPADATATPSSLAPLKSRMVLPFRCRLTQVVQEKRLLNGRSSSNMMGMFQVCAECRSRQTCTKCFSIQRFPRILVIRIFLQHCSFPLRLLLFFFPGTPCCWAIFCVDLLYCFPFSAFMLLFGRRITRNPKVIWAEPRHNPNGRE